MKLFLIPGLISLAALAGAYAFGGAHLLFLAGLLAILEVTLSFDNAVVNAKVLTRMSALWQRRFLTWGILVAVFGTRFILPILIVAVAAGLSPVFVTQLALYDPVAYGQHLAAAHVSIAAFGSAFLFLVSLKYFFNTKKTVHWIDVIEARLSRWGGIEAIEIALVLSVLILCALLVPAEAATLLMSGTIGIILFIFIEGIAQSFEVEGATVAGGAALFVYLNVLDSAFSLDGVVGAFAVTNALPAIILGLGIGALFVRTFTVALVRAKTLESLPYLEHGAHWAILGLALAMLFGIFVHVPETITGLVGLVFISFAYWSSRKAMRAVAA
jgi:hypothetical protein